MNPAAGNAESAEKETREARFFRTRTDTSGALGSEAPWGRAEKGEEESDPER